MTPIATIVRGKKQMLRVSAGTVDGRQVIDMALLPLDLSQASPPNPRKGIAIELATLPHLLSALVMAANALSEGEV